LTGYWSLVTDNYVLPNLKAGDRYSKPTTRNYNGTGKTPAIYGDCFPLALAIADSAKLAGLPDL
jgi:hypothetical protein